MTDIELDEILVHSWPMVMRRVISNGTDEWLKGFVKSIARHGKRAAWRPTPKQARLMRQLVSELGTTPDEPILIEDE